MAAIGAERWQELAPHLDRALDLPGPERLAYLDNVRAGDPLLAADLQSLLHEHQAAVDSGFLDHGPERRLADLKATERADGSDASALTTEPTAPQSLTNRTLGEFLLREIVGRGGFGDVYLAVQMGLGREAVVKVLRPDGITEQRVARFLREAQLASRLDHPYAAHIYAFGAEADGVFWIAMERVRGSTLEALLEAQGPMPVDRFASLLGHICEVVHSAHEQGIVHRDLKPENIMVISRAGRLLPKLVDFGIARALDLATATNQGAARGVVRNGETLGRTTKVGAIMGSPPYMAPELWTDAHQAGPPADQYALGALAFEALTGRRAFSGQSMQDFARAHTESVLASLGDGFPAEVERVLRRALAKDSSQRHPSVLAFAQAFRAAAGVGNTAAEVPPLDDELRRRFLLSAPQPLADAVAAYDGSKNAHQAREALRALVKVATWYVGVLSIACWTRIGPGDPADPEQAQTLLRDLRRRGLTPAGWIALARALTRRFARTPDLFPIPELVLLFEQDDADLPASLSVCLDGSLSQALADASEEAARQAITRELPAVMTLLRSLGFLLDYNLVVAHGDRVESWMGTRKRVLPARGDLPLDRAVLVDSGGSTLLALWPLVQIVAPMPGQPAQAFMLAGPGREAARLVSSPQGFEHHDPDLWDWFRDHLLTDAATTRSSAIADSPYRGLAAYTSGDAAWYFGRERESQMAANRLRAGPFVAIVGPSGVGKSSFVHAGVAPSLEGWRVVSVRPGRSPMLQIGLALRQAGVEVGDLAGTEGQQIISDRVRQWAAENTRLLLVVDQFEEIFTLGCPPDECARFVRLLLASARTAADPVRVIITLRDDFLIRAEQLEGLGEALARGLQLLGPLGSAALERILIEPARRLGYELEAGLAARMVAAAAGTPAAVALISFTASRLWDLRDRHFHQLSNKAYDALGGVGGALARHADKTVDAMPTSERGLVRQAFRHLTTTDGTRTVLTRAELEQLLGGGSEARRLIERLVDARLLSSTEDDRGQAVVEVVHEALLEAWPRLVEWRREDVEGARFHEQLRAASRQWEDRGRPQGLLWRGDALAEYQLWRKRRAGDLTPLENAFAAASVADAARGRVIRRAVLTVVVGLSAVSAVVLWRANVAERHSRSEALRLLRDSTFEQGRLLALRDERARALAQLRKAYEMGESGPANRLLIGELTRSAPALRLVPGHHKLWASLYSPDGRQVAASSSDGFVRIWDADSGAVQDTIPHSGSVRRMAFSPDGKFFAFIDLAGVRLWDRARRRQAALLEIANGRVPGGGPGWVGFDHRSQLLLGTSDKGRAHLWRMPAATPTMRLPGLNGQVIGKFCHRSDCLLTVDESGQAIMWDTRTLRPTARYQHGSPLMVSAIDPAGSAMAVGSRTGELVLLRRDGSVIARRKADTNTLHDVMFSPDGTLVAIGGSDHTGKLWSATTGEPKGEMPGHGGNVTGVAFSPTGDLLATTSITGLRLWSVAGQLLGRLDGHSGPVNNEPDFRADGARMVTASWDGSAIVWDLTAARQFQALPAGRRHFDGEEFPPDQELAVSPDGRRSAVIVEDGHLVVWQSGSSAPRCHLRGGYPMYLVVWSRDDARVATLGIDEPEVRLWNTDSCRLERVLSGPTRPTHSLAFGPDGQLVTAGEDNIARVWNTEGRLLASHGDYPGEIDDVGFTPDGAIYVVTSKDDAPPAVVIQQPVRGSRRVFSGERGSFHDVAFDHRRHRVLAGDLASVWIWDERTGALIDKLTHGPNSGGVVLSPDGAFIVGNYDRAPAVWDAGSRARLGTLEGHEGVVNGGGFLTENLYMTTTRGSNAQVWDLATRRLLLQIPGAGTLAFNSGRTAVALKNNQGTRLWRPAFGPGDVPRR